MVKTFRGADIDMQALALQNEKQIAMGNGKVNVRGDLLGPGGQIIKTREQIVREQLDRQQASGSVDPRGNFRAVDQDTNPPVATAVEQKPSKGKKLSGIDFKSEGDKE